MAYSNRRNYSSSYSRRTHSGRVVRNRIIIVATGVIIFALIVVLISTMFSCLCSTKKPTEPTINTATLGTGKTVKEKKTESDSIQFKEPNIKDDDPSSSGSFEDNYFIWNLKAFEAFNGTKQNTKDFASYLTDVKTKLGLGVNVYSTIVPTHIEMGLPNRLKNDSDGISTTSQADYIKAAYKRYDKKVKYINCYNDLSEHCNDYIYFDSDTAPTALGGYYVYKSFADVMKKKAVTLGDLKESKIQDFYGYYHNFVNTDLNVDIIQYWDFPYTISNTITNTEGEISTVDSCYNKEAGSGSEASNVFLYGKNPLEVIKSESDKAKGKIAIIHNRNGNPVVPYFTYNYEEVYSIDYTIYTGNLKNLCSENNITDVLFITDTESSSDSDQLSKLKNLLSEKSEQDDENAAVSEDSDDSQGSDDSDYSDDSDGSDTSYDSDDSYGE